MRFQDFVTEAYNDGTLDGQISKQEQIIRRAEEQIRHLESLRKKQKNTPWQEWEGTKFVSDVYDSYNSYRDTHCGRSEYTSYLDFVKAIILERDFRFNRNNEMEFKILSPNGEEYEVDDDSEKEMPLLAEYFERIEIEKSIKDITRSLNDLEKQIRHLDAEISQTDKYSEKFIQELKEEKKEAESKLKRIESQAKNENENYIRVMELNKVLSEVDEKLKPHQRKLHAF